MAHLINVGSQEYIPFDFENGEWFCWYSIKGGFTGIHSTHYSNDDIKYYCNGDTIINDIIHHKLYYAGYTDSQINPRTFISGYWGAIRNDTVNRKVWLNGKVLYNFNLQIGNELLFGCTEYVVTGSDSIQYCNRYHKRFELSEVYSDRTAHLIEGIGLDVGLIPAECLTNHGWLRCYQERINSYCDTCNDFTKIEDLNFETVKIFPNPTDGIINIVTTENVLFVEIYDLNGELLDKITEDFAKIRLGKGNFFIIKVALPTRIIQRKVIRY